MMRHGGRLFIYRYLRLARLEEKSFPAKGEALEAACTDLLLERAAPLEIVCDEVVVYDGLDIYSVFDECAWRDAPAQAEAGGAHGR